MNVILYIGGIIWNISSKENLAITDGMQVFLQDEHLAALQPDVKVTFESGYDPISIVDIKGNLVEEDDNCRCYREGDTCTCISVSRDDQISFRTDYTKEADSFHVYVDRRKMHLTEITVMRLLLMIPIRVIFRKFDMLLIHSSQIQWRNRAIVFLAPSGIGKTTQRLLWEQYNQAEPLSNDRTLLRKIDDRWYAFGYPMDGSDPVYTNKKTRLGALVFLGQAEENKLTRPGAMKGMKLLSSQAFLNTITKNNSIEWNLMIDILSKVSFYHLDCTPDYRAVKTLETKLIEKGEWDCE